MWQRECNGFYWQGISLFLAPLTVAPPPNLDEDDNAADSYDYDGGGEEEDNSIDEVEESDVAECPDIQQQHEGWIQEGGSPPPYSAEWWAEIAYPGLYFHIIGSF